MAVEAYPSSEVEQLEALITELQQRLVEARTGQDADGRAVPAQSRRQSSIDLVAELQRAYAKPLGSMLEAGEELAKLGAFVWDANSQRLEWSNGLRAMLGYSPHSAPDIEHALALIHPEDRGRVRRLATLAVCGQEVPATELRLRRPDGKVVYLHAQARPALDATGRLSLVRGAVMDVTENKQLESQLLQAQKLEAVGTLAGGVAHDFNNFLQIIGGHCGLIRLDLALSERSRASLDEVDTSLVRCRELIQRLLAFGRRHVSSPSLNEARTLLGGTTRMLERLLGEDVVLETHLGPEPCPVRLDPVEFEQIIVNLAINARAAMPRGGTLRVDLRRMYLSPDEARLFAVHAGAYCRLQICDTGVGIADDVIERIFEPFFTTKPSGQGTGLGLSTVHGIVSRARGSIRVSSQATVGTCFTVVLPISASEQTVAAVRPHDLRLPGGSETILLVEDRDQVREVTRIQLERVGYQVLVARDGDSAIALAQEHEADIDLLLTDISMPGKSGPELEAALKQHRPRLKTVFMSGYSQPMLLQRLAHVAPRVTLNKPFTMRDLLVAVRQHLDGTRSR